MKSLLVGSNLFVVSVVGLVALLEGAQHFYVMLCSPIAQALTNVIGGR